MFATDSFCALGNVSWHLLTGKLVFLKGLLFCPLSLKESSLPLGNNTWADKKDCASSLWASLAQAAACDNAELKPVLLLAWELVRGWTPSRAALHSNPISQSSSRQTHRVGVGAIPYSSQPWPRLPAPAWHKGSLCSLRQVPPAKKCTLNCIIRKIKLGLFNLTSISPEFGALRLFSAVTEHLLQAWAFSVCKE